MGILGRMATLRDYLKAKGITQEAFAPRINVRQPMLSKLCRGELRPNVDQVLAIHRETDGEVRLEDWELETIQASVTKDRVPADARSAA